MLRRSSRISSEKCEPNTSRGSEDETDTWMKLVTNGSTCSEAPTNALVDGLMLRSTSRMSSEQCEDLVIERCFEDSTDELLVLELPVLEDRFIFCCLHKFSRAQSLLHCLCQATRCAHRADGVSDRLPSKSSAAPSITVRTFVVTTLLTRPLYENDVGRCITVAPWAICLEFVRAHYDVTVARFHAPVVLRDARRSIYERHRSEDLRPLLVAECSSDPGFVSTPSPRNEANVCPLSAVFRNTRTYNFHTSC